MRTPTISRIEVRTGHPITEAPRSASHASCARAGSAMRSIALPHLGRRLPGLQAREEQRSVALQGGLHQAGPPRVIRLVEGRLERLAQQGRAVPAGGHLDPPPPGPDDQERRGADARMGLHVLEEHIEGLSYRDAGGR